MKKTLIGLLLVGWPLIGVAQNNDQEENKSKYIPVFQYWKEHNIFQHLDVSLNAGTTGIGIEVSSPIGDYLKLRAGYEFTPRVNINMNFNAIIGEKAAATSETFAKMSNFLREFSGYEVDDHINMIGKPTLNNVKLLVDVFPFKNNKHWHFTAGIYWGPSRIAFADNDAKAMTSLLSLGIYNRMWEHAMAMEPMVDWTAAGISPETQQQYHLNIIPTEIYDKIKSYGRMGFGLGYYKNDIYGVYEKDVFDIDGRRIHKAGQEGLLHAAGELYVLEPGSDGMVHVTAKSNPLKPYIGFGYGGRLIKGDDNWQISFDAGALFWGGTPDLYTHDGINLTKDVTGIEGQVGSYIDFFNGLKVYPVLSVKITRTIF